MAKTPQRTNKKEAMSKKSYREEIPDYLNTIVFFEGMMTEERALNFGNRMIHFAKTNPKAITFNRFYELEGVYASVVRKWRDKFPLLDVAYEIVRDIFTERRSLIAQLNDNKFISGEMHLYSDLHEQYKILEHQRKRELKNIESESKTKNMELVKEVLQDLMGPITDEQKEQHEQRIRSKTKDTV